MNKTKNKKMNTYLKYGLILICSGILGAFIGGFSVLAENTMISIEQIINSAIIALQKMSIPILITLLIAEVLSGEIAVAKMKAVGKQMQAAEDDENDRLEYVMEKIAAVGNIILILISILSLILISFEYSIAFISSEGSNGKILVDVILFMAIFIYYGYWGIRFVKIQQKIDPKKQGDPASFKFNEQWLESCDEAEKELVYQSAYKTYTLLSRAIPLTMFIAMFMHLIWNTGITAIILLAILWALQTISYLRNCMKKMGQKLTR